MTAETKKNMRWIPDNAPALLVRMTGHNNTIILLLSDFHLLQSGVEGRKIVADCLGLNVLPIVVSCKRFLVVPRVSLDVGVFG